MKTKKEMIAQIIYADPSYTFADLSKKSRLMLSITYNQIIASTANKGCAGGLKDHSEKSLTALVPMGGASTGKIGIHAVPDDIRTITSAKAWAVIVRVGDISPEQAMALYAAK